MLVKLKTLSRQIARKSIQHLGIASTVPLCESILVWSHSRGWPTSRIYNPFVLNFSVPIDLQGHAKLVAQFEANSYLGFPAQHLVCIPQATVKTSSGFITLEEGAYLTEGHWRAANVIDHPLYRNEWPIRESRYFPGDWYCAMGHWGANYNHWIWDELPRLLNALPHLPAGTKFLVPEPLSSVQQNSLLALGIAPEQLVSQAFDCESKVERLWFATPLGHSEWAATAPDIACQLKKTLLDAYEVVEGGDRRLYISRSNAKYRRLVNESELLPVLEKSGFEVIRPEELSFADQIRTFAQASVVMGVHGAGLTNTLFCPTNSLVIELHSPQMTRPHYWMMANTLGHQYRCLVGETIPQEDGHASEPDFQIELVKFTDSLKIFLFS